jgi:hypothetical protein
VKCSRGTSQQRQPTTHHTSTERTCAVIYRMSPTLVDAANVTLSMPAVSRCVPRRREALI